MRGILETRMLRGNNNNNNYDNSKRQQRRPSDTDKRVINNYSIKSTDTIAVRARQQYIWLHWSSSSSSLVYSRNGSQHCQSRVAVGSVFNKPRVFWFIWLADWWIADWVAATTMQTTATASRTSVRCLYKRIENWNWNWRICRAIAGGGSGSDRGRGSSDVNVIDDSSPFIIYVHSYLHMPPLYYC